MCDYFLQGKCFHPKRTQKGIVAAQCDVHSCNHCTHKQWQDSRIQNDHSFYEGLIASAKKDDISLPKHPFASKSPQ